MSSIYQYEHADGTLDCGVYKPKTWSRVWIDSHFSDSMRCRDRQASKVCSNISIAETVSLNIICATDLKEDQSIWSIY